MKTTALLILFSVIALPGFSHAQGWEWVNPLPQGNTIYDIHVFDANTAIAVGAAGTVMRTSDGGESWGIQHNVADVLSALRGVCFNGATGIAVGLGGIILRTTDGGNTWQQQASVTDLDLYDVVLVDSLRGFAVGGDTSDGGVMLRTDDGGQTWTSLDLPEEVVMLREITFVNNNFGVAVGIYNLIYRTLDGGQTWSVHTFIADPSKSPLDVAFFNENLGIAVGLRGGIVRTEDGGETWTQPPRITSIDIHSVAFLDSLNVMAVSGGRVLFSSDAGKTWEQLSTLIKGVIFNGIRFIDKTNGFIVGSAGTIFTTKDGGQTWTKQSNGTTEDLRDVSFPNNNLGFAVGTKGSIFKSTDGGSSWVELESGVDNRLEAVSFINTQTGGIAASDGLILWTQNGGQAWFSINSPTTEDLDDIYLFDDSTAILVGNSNIYKTWDTGETWMLTFEGIPADPQKVDFWNADTGMAVGGIGSTILTTTDGGLSWTQRETNLVLILHDVAYRDYDSAVAVGNRGTILLTDDGGITWRLVALNFERGLRAVCFLNPSVGIAVGSLGTIFKTTDSGETWVRQASAVGNFLHGAAITRENSAVVVGVLGSILKTNQLHVVSVKDDSPKISTSPKDFVLEQNYPNPFNPSTTISYEVQKKAWYNLTIYNVKGRQVRELQHKLQTPGSYRVQWDGSDDNGRLAPTGIYFARMSSRFEMQVIKLLYIK